MSALEVVPDDQRLREIALDQAARISSGDGDKVLETAKKFYEFLKGEAP